MKTKKSSKFEKIIGAIIPSLFFGALTLFIPAIITVLQFTEIDKMPWPFFFFIIVIFALPLIGIIYNLIVRIIEINGGEEDEASKY